MTTGSFPHESLHPRAVPFGSDTSLKSESGYQCLIRRVIDHYGQFQNGRRKMFFPKMYF